MVNQPKRIQADSSAIGVNQQVSVRFGPGTGTILRRLVNYHNIWFGFSCEPVNADANAAGTWVLWQNQDATNADPTWDFATLGDGTQNMRTIACGVWAAANQMPFNFSSQLKSSRNMVANNELVLSVRVLGLTAGNVQIQRILCASLTVK